MADNTKIWPIFRSANWWLSDDLFTGVKNSFYYSNNMEIREDSKSIYPKQNPRYTLFDLWLRSSVWSVVAVLSFNNARYAFAEKSIFKIYNGAVTTIASWMTSIKDAELFNWYVYISTSSHLYRISQTAADADWASSTNFTDISINTSSYHPLYATTNTLAVGNKTSVDQVTKEVPDQLQSWITLQSDYIVKFIDELGWFLRITANDSNYWWEILLWDKVSKIADEVIPMNWYLFVQSCVYNWYHYLLSNKWLGLVNGYQYYILKRLEDIDTSDIINNGMLVYDDKLYFVTSDWIFIYWAKNKNYTDVLNMWSSRLDEYWKPMALWTDWNYLIYTEGSKSGLDDKVHTYAYLYVDWWEHWDNGELQTMAYFWNSLSEIKQSMYLRLWYYLGSWSIKVYYRTEADITNSSDPNNWAWHEITPTKWLYDVSDMRSPFATSLKLNCRFQRIQFKFVITQFTNPSSMPTRIYSADLYYNDMLD